METLRSLGSDLVYLKALVGAGFDGIRSTPQKRNRAIAASPWLNAVWTPMAIGASLGILSTRAAGKKQSASRMALGGLVGTLVGLGAGHAWASRGMIGPAAKSAIRRVNAARDIHWLETHPITYA